MLGLIARNIKDFFDMTVFFTILFIGLFTLFSDYPYFKRVKYKRDAAVTMVIGIVLLVLPFALWIFSAL